MDIRVKKTVFIALNREGRHRAASWAKLVPTVDNSLLRWYQPLELWLARLVANLHQWSNTKTSHLKNSVIPFLHRIATEPSRLWTPAAIPLCRFVKSDTRVCVGTITRSAADERKHRFAFSRYFHSYRNKLTHRYERRPNHWRVRRFLLTVSESKRRLV